jgi:ATP-dependent 26S proteasome regulatory subunit
MSVLSLFQLDGFEPDRKTIVIAATNRKEDLDAALLSRFDTALTFGLPDLRQVVTSGHTLTLLVGPLCYRMISK